jgi:hypothetical protein
MISVLVILTVVGPVWPWFVRFRPIANGLAATMIFAAVWAGSVFALANRHGWHLLWFFLAAPLLLYWPLLYVFMSGCISSNSCP